MDACRAAKAAAAGEVVALGREGCSVRGSFLLFFGMSAMVASMVEGVVWWRYWPAYLRYPWASSGMVVPGEEGHRMRQFVDSLITFSAGVVLVLMSLDVIGWRSIEFMLVGLWPLLLIMVGLLLLGGRAQVAAARCWRACASWRSAWWDCCGTLVPGATEELVFSAVTGASIVSTCSRWKTSV